MASYAPTDHPFLTRPHRTLASLSAPVLVSLVAEPLIGIIDTAFIARQGTVPLAALGVGTIVLSAVFWIFGFLGVGTQSFVARELGAGHPGRAREIAALALVVAFVAGLGVLALGIPTARPVGRLMGAEGAVLDEAVRYVSIRWIGAPIGLVVTASFGALRGVLDMKTPLAITAVVLVVNIVLDALLISGAGPIPAYGVAGAAWASVAAHLVGAVLAVIAVRRRLGWPRRLVVADARPLLLAGRDLALRTGLLVLFLLLATRAATRIGPEAGAAHQAVRQAWVFAALTLDAFASSAVSLVGLFHGAHDVGAMRRVARLVCGWSVATGVVIALLMLVFEEPVARLLVPEEARGVFAGAWLVAALIQPVGALSFATDGVHWGSADWSFLRNAMFVSTSAAALLLTCVDERSETALVTVWIVTGVWLALRAGFGLVRVWPGVGASPFRTARFATAGGPS